ncbi:MAG: hypothetical protein IPH72_31360 [Sandaracinaceae bacterium]|nr:hypothetical protein [Sandaracinaceae bacterium]
MATSESPIVETGWRFIEGPGDVTLEPPVGERALFTPSVVGSHVVRFRAANADGLVAECDVTVSVVVGPPVAICPEEAFRTPVGSSVLLEGSGFDDDAVVAYQWTWCAPWPVPRLCWRCAPRQRGRPTTASCPSP